MKVPLELNKCSGFSEPMARKTGSHAEHTGPKVRQVALKLFAQFGYAAVSMRQIAREVGVQAGALYTYTPDKQALLFDLLRTHMRDLLDTLSKAPPQSSPPARLEQFVRFHIDYHIDRSAEVFISYMELRNLSPDNFAAIERYRRQYEAELERILEDGKRAGVFAITDKRVAAMGIIAMLTGVNTWFRDGGRLSRDEVADVHWNMVRKMVETDEMTLSVAEAARV